MFSYHVYIHTSIVIIIIIQQQNNNNNNRGHNLKFKFEYVMAAVGY